MRYTKDMYFGSDADVDGSQYSSLVIDADLLQPNNVPRWVSKNAFSYLIYQPARHLEMDSAQAPRSKRRHDKNFKKFG